MIMIMKIRMVNIMASMILKVVTNYQQAGYRPMMMMISLIMIKVMAMIIMIMMDFNIMKKNVIINSAIIMIA